MNNFEFISPTKVYLGDDYDNKVREIISSYGYKKIAVIYGGGSIKKIG